MELYQEAVRLLRIGSIRPNRALAYALEGLAAAYCARGELELSKRFSREGLEVSFASEDFLGWVLRSNLGGCLGRMHRFEEGHDLLMASYRGLVAWAGPTEPNTIECLTLLIALHQAWGTGDGAAEHRAEVEQMLSGEARARWRSEMQVIPGSGAGSPANR